MLIKIKNIIIIGLALVTSLGQTSELLPAKKKVGIEIEAIRSSLKGLPAVEIPIKASESLQKVSEDNQIETAKIILKEVLLQRPQMAVQMVASLIKAVPKIASDITSTAIFIVPQFADVIIRAAVISAPDHALEIAVASVQIFPDNKADVLNIISLAVPSSAGMIATNITNIPTRLIFNPSADNHAIGGLVSTINHGISHPWPSEVLTSYSSGSAGFDPRRYNN